MNPNDTPPLDDREAVKAYFIAERGYWRPWTDTMLQAAPGFVAQYARYAGHPARTGPLSPRMVELIYVGLDASSSHLFESGLLTHMRRALEVGATQRDIIDVLHLVAVQGVALEVLHLPGTEPDLAPRRALFLHLPMLPLAVPGWTLLPVMRTVALAALKFSYSSSPSSPPSTV